MVPIQRILAQCKKELAQFRRDRLTLALAFLLPTITLLIYGFALRLQSDSIPLIVQDFDRTSLSSSYIERLYATNQFVPVQWPEGVPSQDLIDGGVAKVAVIIPPQFSRAIEASRSIEVQVLIDATDVNNARIIKNNIQNVTNFFLIDQQLAPSTNTVKAQIRLWFNPGRLESLYFVPGIYGVVLWIYPSLLTAIAMAREKERGTILQVYASSITAAEFLLGKGLAYLLIAICEAFVAIVIASVVFQITLVGNFIILILGTLLFLINSVLFGLLLGARSSNQNSAVQGVTLIGFITSLLLSGFIYPLNNIPFPISLLPNLVPPRYYIHITRDVFVRGIGWSGIWFDLLMLAIFGLLLFNASYHVIKRMQLSD
ncbi:ABC transporter permease [Nostoc sp. WHI]|uniref:ABC transporter permease n=1 Tax=Nostoc sp. WHI TaxID=2650611 RepID=UPI001E3DCE13|nr:ABC transporter permease [Nostoc sp. WHI]MBG1271042.1 ABC transporter permease [Nostoc sp. WHI]